MSQLSATLHSDISEVLDEVSALMSAAYAQPAPYLLTIRWLRRVLRMGQKSFWATSRTASQASPVIIRAT